jgi:hypothetical protein
MKLQNYLQDGANYSDEEIAAFAAIEADSAKPKPDAAKFGKACYKYKLDVSHQVGPEKIAEMAEWIESELQNFWLLNRKLQKPIAASK